MISAGWKWIERGTDLLWPASLELVFAATLLLLIAVAMHLVLRRAAASLRHRVWALTMGALLLLPLLCSILPKLPLPLNISLALSIPAASKPAASTPEPAKGTVPFLPTQKSAQSPLLPQDEPSGDGVAFPAAHRAYPLPQPSSALPADAPANAAYPRPAVASTANTPIGDGRSLLAKSHCALILVWALGTALYLLAMARWLRLERRLAKNASELDDPSWQALLEELKLQFGIRWAVAIRVSQDSEVPLAVGWRRPMILLPADCRCWPAEKCRVVLAHELSHVARHDVFWQVVARLACAVYWFHPLAWLAERRMRVERELACDDAVLRSGNQPDQYAAVLLDVAAAVGRRPRARAAAIAMACRHPIQRRIRAILQPGINRLPVGPRTGRLSLAAALLLAVLAAGLHPFAPPQVKAEPRNATVARTKSSAIFAATKLEKPGDPPKSAASNANPNGSATPAASSPAPTAASLPRRTQISNDKYSAVAVQTEKDVNFVLVYRGSLSTGMEDWYTDKAWGFDGGVYLVDVQKTRVAKKNVDKRKFAVKYTSSAPRTLFLDGKANDLSQGRIFILRDEGEPGQNNHTLPLRNEKDLVTIGDFAESRAGELQPKDKQEQDIAGVTGKVAVAVPGEVKGRVVDENGKPVAGADIWLPVWLYGIGTAETSHTTSDAQGRFVVDISAALLAKIRWWDWATTVLWAYAPDHQVGTARAEKLSGASEVVIRLGPETDTSFIVLDPQGQPCAGALVEPDGIRTPAIIASLPDELRPNVAARTDAEGRVRLPAVSRETLYNVRITTKEFGVQVQRVLKSEPPATQDFGIQMHRVEKSKPPATAGGTVHLRPVGKIEGRLIADPPETARNVGLFFSTEDRRARPAEDDDIFRKEYLALHPEHRSIPWPTEGNAEVKSDKDGRFVVPALADGDLQIYVKVNENQPLRPRLPDHVRSGSGATTLLDIPLIPTVIARGSVREKGTGKPLPGALVCLSYGVERQGASAVTDAKGSFTARVLPGRISFQLIAAPRGYVQVGEPWNGDRDVPNDEIDVPKDAEEFDLPPIELAPAKNIEGHLVDASDRPVAHVKVDIGAEHRYYGTGESDSSGKFRLNDVPATIDLTKAEFMWTSPIALQKCKVLKTDPLILRALPRDTRAPGKTRTHDLGTPDESKLSADAARAKVTAPKSSEAATSTKVAGRVIDENGRAVDGAEVWLRLREHVQYAKADSQGQFSLEVPSAWLAELPRTLWAYAAGHQLGRANVELSSSASNLTIRLAPGSDTSFVVTDPEGRPCADALVEPYYIRNGRGNNEPLPDELLARAGARTDAEGRVKLPAVPPDLLYQVRVHAKGFGTQVQPTTPASAIVASAIRLRPVGKIEGRVVGDLPELVRGVELVFTSSENNRPRPFPLKVWPIDGYAKVKTDEQGRFTVPVIAVGDAGIWAVVDEKQPLRLKLPETVRVQADRTTSLEIPLVPSVIVRGAVRVKDSGKPVPGAEIDIRFGVNRQRSTAVSDALGNYTARVLPGRISLQVIDMPAPYVLLSEGAARLTNDRSFEVAKDAKEFDLPPIEAGLAGPTKSIPGRVVDQQDRPAGNIQIFVVERDRDYGYGKSDKEGRFELTGVPVTINPGKAKYGWLPEVGPGKPFVSTELSKCEVLKTDPLLLRALPRDPVMDMP